MVSSHLSLINLRVEREIIMINTIYLVDKNLAKGSVGSMKGIFGSGVGEALHPGSLFLRGLSAPQKAEMGCEDQLLLPASSPCWGLAQRPGVAGKGAQAPPINSLRNSPYHAASWKQR